MKIIFPKWNNIELNNNYIDNYYQIGTPVLLVHTHANNTNIPHTSIWLTSIDDDNNEILQVHAFDCMGGNNCQ